MIHQLNRSVLDLVVDIVELPLFPALLLLYFFLVAAIAFKEGDNRHIGFKWSFLLMLFGFFSGLIEVLKSNPIDRSPKKVRYKDHIAFASNLTIAIVLFCALLFTQLYLGFLFIPFMVRAIYYYYKYNDMIANPKMISD